MSVKAILSNDVCLGDRYIPDYDALGKALQILRDSGNKISMTQGVYDLIHIGHVRYLEKAKKYGDVLVVAVDTDAYTRKRKQRANERRPVVPFKERLELLANLRSVDILTIRDLDYHEADPDYVIKIVRPEVLVMSSGTKDVNNAKHDELRTMLKSWGGKMEILKPRAVNSTTQSIRDLMIDGSAGLADHVVKCVRDYFAAEGRTFKV